MSGGLPTRSELAAQLDVEIEGWETITPVQRAYLAALIETAGNQGRAADAAGVHRSTPWKWSNGWKDSPPNPAYLEALELAKTVAANVLEDEARRRAFEGVRRFKFDKNGKPLRHPKRCECGHELEEHDRPRQATGEAWEARREAAERGEEIDTTVRPCLSCTCSDFHGAPYFEHEYSDKLLKLLLGAKLPEEYATRRVEVSGALRNLNWDALPDHVIARLAAGEHPYSVLAGAANEIDERYLLSPGVELGGPGAGSSDEPDGGERLSSGSDAGDDL